MKRIYLDHASIAPLDPRVRAVMEPWMQGAWNPSALHAEGRQARVALDRARQRLATLWVLSPREILMVASGSASVALAILGSARAQRAPGTFWTTAAEHAVVLRCAALLHDEGWQIRWLPVDAAARVNLAVLQSELQEPSRGARLVSLMLVNNELGTLNPVLEAAHLAHTYDAVFHCDAIAAGETIDVREVIREADFISLAAQKCGGPVGSGVLIRRGSHPLVSLVPGGPQEAGLHAGTENLVAIVGATQAFVLREEEQAMSRVSALQLQERLESRLLAAFSEDELRITGRHLPRSPQISHLSFANLHGPALLAATDLQGLAVSAGSACAAGALEPSPVMKAIGLQAPWTGLLRLSWGKVTSLAEIDEAIERLLQIIYRMREVRASLW